MAAALNRAAFFDAVRTAPFGGKLSVGQVSGMEAMLDACPPDLGLDALAYCLATALHETARTMQPVKEYGGTAYYTRMYDITGDRPQKARELGNTQPGDGAKFAGRGYVQLTGRANYRRATGELQNHGYLSKSQDLTVAPDMAMTPDIAAAIMYLGMQAGWFTGQKLSNYFGAGALPDPTNARRIINGLDKATTIAGYFSQFQTALRAAKYAPGGVQTAPIPPVETAPLFPPAPRNGGSPPASEPPKPAITPPTQPAPAKGFWASMLERLRTAYPPKG